MGLQDRDYMHERQREALRRGPPRSRSAAGPNLPWKSVVLTIALLALVAFLASRWTNRHTALPFPETGQVHWYTHAGEGSGASLTIAAPSLSGRNHVVQLGDWSTGKVIAMIPIRAGETAQLEVPLGQYSITIASGDRWLGPEKLFGSSGELRKVVSAMHFYKTGLQTMGHRIDLAKRVNGNLETRPVGPFER